jgi:hypothetical protein
VVLCIWFHRAWKKNPPHPEPEQPDSVGVGKPRVKYQMTQTPPSRRPAPRAAKPRVSMAVERQIDENLKKLYTQSLEEELPESLRALVARLRQDGAAQ